MYTIDKILMKKKGIGMSLMIEIIFFFCPAYLIININTLAQFGTLLNFSDIIISTSLYH